MSIDFSDDLSAPPVKYAGGCQHAIEFTNSFESGAEKVTS